MTEPIETVIIGGGQAGLAMSYHLSRLGWEHVILEERWPGHPAIQTTPAPRAREISAERRRQASGPFLPI